MGDNTDFKSWAVPEFTEEDKDKLLGEIERKFTVQKRRNKNIKICASVVVFLAIAISSVLVFERSGFKKEMAGLNKLLQEDINDQLLYYTDRGHMDTLEKEEPYVSSLD